MVTHGSVTVFEGSFTHEHSSRTIPAGSGVSKASAIAKLHDHALFLDCGPYLVSYSAAPAPAWASYALPQGVRPLAPRVAAYDVKNKYENPIMGADISCTYEFVDLADGVWLRTHSPMGTVLDGAYTVREQGDGSLEILYQATCRCNKALASMAKKEHERSSPVLVENLVKRIGG